MNRLLLITAALAALGFGVAASAHDSHTSRQKTIRLDVHWTARQMVDSRPKGSSAGDLAVTAGDLLARGTNRKLGRIQGHCVNVPPENADCSFTLALRGGHLHVLSGYGKGFSGETTGRDAIVGGTGAYKYARGDITSHETGEDKVELTVRLRR